MGFRFLHFFPGAHMGRLEVVSLADYLGHWIQERGCHADAWLGHHQTTSFTYLGVRHEHLSGLEKFEAPDPAEWCPRGYVVVNADARGVFDSEGDIFILGTQVRAMAPPARYTRTL